MVGLGLVIVARGILAAAPWSYVLLGALLTLLGAYRLYLFRHLGTP
jgi:hypothetical protein